MSHFTVLVVADDEEHLAEQLAPYREEASDEFTEFTDMTDEWTEESKHVITRAEDKSIVEKHPEAEGKTLLEFYGRGDFATYMAEWHGVHDTEDGRYGYRSNPNAQWDWYSIGGRWKDVVINGDTCLVKDFNKTKVQAELDPPTFAMVDRNGEWIQKGQMGWFGCASNVDKDGYRKEFWEAMDELSPNDRLYVVDCHI